MGETTEEEYGFIDKYWVICIAVLVIAINIGCRIKDSIASRDYDRTSGVVVSVRSETTPIFYGRYYHFYSEQTSRYTTIEYKVPDSYDVEWFEVEFEWRYLAKGDTIPVMYKPEGYDYVQYPARRDWITGAWLDARKDYNTPLIIGIIMIAPGIGYMYVIGAMKPRFRNSWIVISVAGLLIGGIATYCYGRLIIEGGEMAEEAFHGEIIGLFLTLFSFLFMIKMHQLTKLKEKK